MEVSTATDGVAIAVATETDLCDKFKNVRYMASVHFKILSRAKEQQLGIKTATGLLVETQQGSQEILEDSTHPQALYGRLPGNTFTS